MRVGGAAWLDRMARSHTPSFVSARCAPDPVLHPRAVEHQTLVARQSLPEVRGVREGTRVVRVLRLHPALPEPLPALPERLPQDCTLDARRWLVGRWGFSSAGDFLLRRAHGRKANY